MGCSNENKDARIPPVRVSEIQISASQAGVLTKNYHSQYGGYYMTVYNGNKEAEVQGVAYLVAVKQNKGYKGLFS